MTADQVAVRAEFERRREERIRHQYAELRASDPEVFRKCVQYAEGILRNHRELATNLTDAERSKLAADIETAMVSLAIEVRRG